MSRIHPIDSLRAVCAFWVFFAHVGSPPIASLLPAGMGGLWLVLFNAALGILFNGAAAVMCFFIISGFCIHYPLKDRSLPVAPFLVRRLIRVGVPLVAIEAIVLLNGMRETIKAVEWSIICELIYYALYPLLRLLVQNRGWIYLNIAAFVPAVLLSMRPDSNMGFFWVYGDAWTWLLGLPVWLLGVSIAHYARLDRKPANSIWFYRLGIWGLSSYFVAMHFHSPVPVQYKHTMLVFSIPAALWIVAEIRNAHPYNFSPLLEWAGSWSYSLYLCHRFLITSPIVGAIAGFLDFHHPFFTWSLTIVLGTVVSMVFYKLVENTSHALARILSGRVPGRYVVV